MTRPADPSSNTEKVHLRDLSLDDLRHFVESHDVPSYRFEQIASWLYEKLAEDFTAMTNLPISLRDRLDSEAIVQTLTVASTETSRLDGTRKYLFSLNDGDLVESVLIPHERRTTLCVSSQVGCPLDCVFCQTGKGVYSRNLTSGEILDQICHLKRECRDLSDKVNVVFMGMGEPLLNYDALVKTIRVLNDPNGLDMGSKRITVSTAGIPRRMKKLADEGLRCSLALSLNASNDAQRRELMPAVGRYSIDEVLEAATYFYKQGAKRVTLEYVMLKGINTQPEDARRLGKLARRGPFKVNLIPYNAGRDGDFEAVTEDVVQEFIRVLLPYAPAVTVRRSKGPDIAAACGQLWTQSLADKKRPAKGTRDSQVEGLG